MIDRRMSFLAGALAGAAAMAAVLSAAGVVTLQAQPGVRYTSKVVLENERVRVRDVTFPAGVMDTGMHTHDLPHVGVIITSGSLVFTEAGKPTETANMDAGSVGYRAANVTHQVANPGKAPMRVIEVELK
jgi:quercetin dioxygenase-like cupin family protein